VGKKYFMTSIDDSTRYCYVCLLKTKDEALDFFKIYKGEVENQLERKIKKGFGPIVVVSTFIISSIYYVRKMV
jgi:hypothetical protein